MISINATVTDPKSLSGVSSLLAKIKEDLYLAGAPLVRTATAFIKLTAPRNE